MAHSANDGLCQPVRSAVLRSFDRGFRDAAAIVRPDRYRDIERVPSGMPRIVRGGGFSYAAASFGGGALVQDFRSFDRVLAFDQSSGRVRCEAGITLGKLFDFALRRGLYLAVQPGHPDITLGGCIASDAHGKHPSREGTFRQQVLDLTLFHPDHGSLELDPQRSPELFGLTCGGYGLTGHIVAATLQLRPLPAAWEIRRLPVPRLAGVGELLEEHEDQASLLYSWHNLSASGAAFGRGHLYVGRFLDGESERHSAARRACRPLPEAGAWRLPVWNRFTTTAFNGLYERFQALGPDRLRPAFFDFMFPIASKSAYFHFFGRRGFHEYQVLVPRQSFTAFVGQLEAGLRRFPTAPTLASCKLFAGSGGLLRFDGAGVGFAIDFARTPASDRFADFLDHLACDLGALPNLIKDSRLPQWVAARCYPAYDEFRLELRRFDDRRLYRSELSTRLAL